MHDVIHKLASAMSGHNPWAALDHLPQVVSIMGDGPEDWPEQDLGSCVIALACVSALMAKLEDDDLPSDLDGPDRELLVRCGYSKTNTVPRLCAARTLLDSTLQLSSCFPRHFEELARRHADNRTVPALEALASLRNELPEWVETALFGIFENSDYPWREKILFLNDLSEFFTKSLSLYFIRVAAERWPADIEGIPAWEIFVRISMCAQHLATDPRFIIATDPSTWTKVADIAETVAKTYAIALRQRLADDGAPNGKEFVAIIDPQTALSQNLLLTIAPWMDAVAHKFDAPFEKAVEKFKRVRGKSDGGRGTAVESIKRYTDFVSFVEGDGSWPQSIPDAEYVARDIIAAGTFERALTEQQAFLTPTRRGWVLLRTPWMLPISIADNLQSRAMHRRSPLLAWMMHASTNPYASQNMFSGMDLAVSRMEKVLDDEREAEKFKNAMLAAESILFPMGTALAASGLVPFLLPLAPKYLIAACASVLYPGFKLTRGQLKK